MTLIEKLLSVDKEKATEKETKKIKSKRLSKLVGEGAEITIKELSGKRYNSLQSMLYDKKGNRDMNATYDFNLMCCVYGVTEPCLTDHTLMEALGCCYTKRPGSDSFGMESGNIAAEIIKLSGLGENAEDEVKNS
mgnify:CR=1 FL=1